MQVSCSLSPAIQSPASATELDLGLLFAVKRQRSFGSADVRLVDYEHFLGDLSGRDVYLIAFMLQDPTHGVPIALISIFAAWCHIVCCAGGGSVDLLIGSVVVESYAISSTMLLQKIVALPLQLPVSFSLLLVQHFVFKALIQELLLVPLRSLA